MHERSLSRAPERELAPTQGPDIIHMGQNAQRVGVANVLTSGQEVEKNPPDSGRDLCHGKVICKDEVLNEFRKRKAKTISKWDGPYLRCLEPHEAKQVIEEIHDGYCGNHKGGRRLASKVLRTGYFWPTLKADYLAYSSKCEACQLHSPFIHQPSDLLHSISAPDHL
ncbi:uncharacterized protein LOC141631242 [Silene latifolia]|uniref:uncharacterized protein LOC141631242 n=1 Tax=Silene latifolia TaxID=37657 RepID=UPI003D7781E9